MADLKQAALRIFQVTFAAIDIPVTLQNWGQVLHATAAFQQGFQPYLLVVLLECCGLSMSIVWPSIAPKLKLSVFPHKRPSPLGIG